MGIPKLISQKDFAAMESDKTSLIAKCSELEKENERLRDEWKTSTELQVEHNNVITTLKAEHEKALNELKAGYDKQISDMKTETKLVEASSEAKARSVLNQIGVPADEMPKVETKSKTQVLAEAKHLQGEALSNFILNNRAAIRNAFAEANKKDK